MPTSVFLIEETCWSRLITPSTAAVAAPPPGEDNVVLKEQKEKAGGHFIASEN